MVGVPMSKAASFHLNPHDEPSSSTNLTPWHLPHSRFLTLFPTSPSTYHPRRPTEHSFLTLFTASIALLLITNDIAELIWGWSDYEFGVDHTPMNYLVFNVD